MLKSLFGVMGGGGGSLFWDVCVLHYEARIGLWVESFLLVYDLASII